MISEFDELDEEVKELLRNYKHKRATVYEPCTSENFKECLIGLGEELGVLNINYTFNPYIDSENSTLLPDALVKLINAVWTLLHHHKASLERIERLTEQTHTLEQTNKQLNISLGHSKRKSIEEKSEAKACVASAQRISDRSEEIFKTLSETQTKLTQVTKQKENVVNSLKHEISRLKNENEKLMDKLRNKSGAYVPCTEVCDSTLLQLRERDRKQKKIISQLQNNNQDLLREVIALKEELVLGGLRDYHFQKGKK